MWRIKDAFHYDEVQAPLSLKLVGSLATWITEIRQK